MYQSSFIQLEGNNHQFKKKKTKEPNLKLQHEIRWVVIDQITFLKSFKNIAISLVIFVLLAFAFFALNLAAEYCDPDSNGEPECNADNFGQAFRNFWDPVHYWLCNNATDPKPASIRCPTETLFDDAQKECISWRVWNWTFPCPDMYEPVATESILE